MKKKNPQYLRQLVGVRYCGIFYKEITSDLRVKKKKKKIIHLVCTETFPKN